MPNSKDLLEKQYSIVRNKLKNLRGFWNHRENAIKNAEKLENLYFDRSFSNHYPCTKVHKLINELIELTEKYAAQQQV